MAPEGGISRWWLSVFHDFAEEDGGVAAGGVGEGEFEEGAVGVFAGGEGEVGGEEPEGAATAWGGEGSGETFGGEVEFLEDFFFHDVDERFGFGHAEAVKGAGGGDFVGAGTGLFLGGRVGVGGDEEGGAVFVFSAEIAGEDDGHFWEAAFEEFVEEVGLERGDEELFELHVDGEHGAFGVAFGADHGGEGGAFIAQVAGPLVEGVFVVAFFEGLAGGEDAAVVDGFVGVAEEAVGEGFGVVGDKGEAEEVVVFAHAEALGSEEVGDAGEFEGFEDGLGFFGGFVEGEAGAGPFGVADFDDEAVAGEVAAFDFVVVAGEGDDFHSSGEAFFLEGFGAVGVEVFDGEPLGGDGLFVFEAGVADVHVFAAEGFGEDVGGGHGGEAAFFDFEVAVGADAGGGVGGEFLDAEVFEVLLDQAAGAGEVGGEVDGGGGLSGEV